MHDVKYIAITACEGLSDNRHIYKGQLFTSYRGVDRALRMLAPCDEGKQDCFKCFVTVTFDDDEIYTAKLELTYVHRHCAAVLLPHMVSHCEVMSGRVIPPDYTPDSWAQYLDTLEESTPKLRDRYSKMLDAYLP